jgi:LemA protein
MNPSVASALFAIGIVVIVVGFVVVTTYNAVVALRNRIRKAWANIDVALKQRHDMLPGLVDAVRGIMAFEQEVFEEIARARAAYTATDPIPRQAEVSDATTIAVRSLFAVVEAYPELKSAGNVQLLQAEIARIEDVIGDRRELYNDQVFRLNTRIAQLPANLFAGLFAWAPEPFFAAGEAERARPEVDIRPA